MLLFSFFVLSFPKSVTFFFLYDGFIFCFSSPVSLLGGEAGVRFTERVKIYS